MPQERSPIPMKAVVYIPYGLAVLVVLIIFGRYVFRLGDPPDPPAQGEGIASLRGNGIFILDHPLDARTRELIAVFSDGKIDRWVLIDGQQRGSNAVPIRPALLDATLQFQKKWCQQTDLPPTPPPTTETYRLSLTCTAWTGRNFYFAKDQLPQVLVDALQEAPPLDLP